MSPTSKSICYDIKPIKLLCDCVCNIWHFQDILNETIQLTVNGNKSLSNFHENAPLHSYIMYSQNAIKYQKLFEWFNP